MKNWLFWSNGKESSNPFMAGSLPKTIHLCDLLQSDEDSFELQSDKDSFELIELMIHFKVMRFVIWRIYACFANCVVQERISKKRTKNEAKTTKPDTEWKSVEKDKVKSKPKCQKVNPDKSKGHK
ncbi:hypothetical protein Tco_1577336 [Tanacetum coccineum]